MQQKLWQADMGNGRYKNPVLPADYSDPDAIRVGEDYYLISSSFTYLPGVPVLHSRDLVNWQRIGYCVRELPFSRYQLPAHGCGTWAPSLRWHNGMFYAFIPLPDEGIFVTTATDPAGEWTPLRCVKSASGWIDPCPLWDDDGKLYMAHAFANSRCGIKHKIQLSTLNPDTLEVVDDGPVIFDGTLSQPTAEGPKMYKRNGFYYIFFPAGGVATGWQSVLRAKNIFGPYEAKIVMHQGNTTVNGPHQGAWVDAPDGSDWFLHFQDCAALGRVVHLQPMCWQNDWPFIGLEQNGDGIGEPITEWTKPCGTAVGSLAIGDDFVDGEYGLQWQWQANPAAGWYTPCAGKRTLCLNCLPMPLGTSSVWQMPNVLSQMLPQADFTVETTLKLVDAAPQARGALGVLGLQYSLAELVQTESGFAVCLLAGVCESNAPTATATETELALVAVGQNTATLRLEIKNARTVQYSLQCSEGIWMPLGTAQPITNAVWTGARLALLARGTGCGRCEFSPLQIYDSVD